MSRVFKGIERGLGVLAIIGNKHTILKREAYNSEDYAALIHTVFIAIMTPNHCVQIAVRQDFDKPPITKLKVSLSVSGSQFDTDGFVDIVASKVIIRGIKADSIQNSVVEYLNSTGVVELRDLYKNAGALGYNKLYSNTIFHLADVASKNSGLMRIETNELGRAVTVNRGTSGGEVLSKIYLLGNPSVGAGGEVFKVKYIELDKTAKALELSRDDTISLGNLSLLEKTIRGMQGATNNLKV